MQSRKSYRGESILNLAESENFLRKREFAIRSKVVAYSAEGKGEVRMQEGERFGAAKYKILLFLNKKSTVQFRKNVVQ